MLDNKDPNEGCAEDTACTSPNLQDEVDVECLSDSAAQPDLSPDTQDGAHGN